MLAPAATLSSAAYQGCDLRLMLRRPCSSCAVPLRCTPQVGCPLLGRQRRGVSRSRSLSLRCRAGSAGLRQWQSRAWRAVNVGACLVSVAGAVGFFLTSEVFLLGLPVTLPLVALLASKSQEKLQTEALFERYRIAMGNAATPELVKECLQDTVSEFQTELQSQQRLPAAQLRALNTKLSSLEGSILTAGRSAQTAASQAYGSADRVAQATITELRYLRRQLQQDLQELVPGVADPVPVLESLNKRMKDVEDRLVSLDSRQSALIQGAQNDLVIAWEDAEVALQAVVRAETMRCLEPLRHLPRTLANALPVTDVTAMTVAEPRAVLMQQDCDKLQAIVAAEVQAMSLSLAQQQEEAMQVLAAQPFALADSQWGSLGRRLTSMELQLQGLLDRPAQSEGPASGQVQARAEEFAVQLQPLMSELTNLKDIVSSQALMSKQSIHGLANGASGQTEQKADEAASLQGTVQQDRHLDSTGLEHQLVAPSASPADAGPQLEQDTTDIARQDAFQRMQALLAAKGPVERDASVHTLASPHIPSALSAEAPSEAAADSSGPQPFASWLGSMDEDASVETSPGTMHDSPGGDILPLEAISPQLEHPQQQLLHESYDSVSAEAMSQGQNVQHADGPSRPSAVQHETQPDSQTMAHGMQQSVRDPAPSLAPADDLPALVSRQQQQQQDDGAAAKSSAASPPNMAELHAPALQSFSWKQSPPDSKASSNGRSSMHRTHKGYRRPSFLAEPSSSTPPGMHNHAADAEQQDMPPLPDDSSMPTDQEDMDSVVEAGAMLAAAELSAAEEPFAALSPAMQQFAWQQTRNRDPRTRDSRIIDSSLYLPDGAAPDVQSGLWGAEASSSNGSGRFSMPLDPAIPPAFPADTAPVDADMDGTPSASSDWQQTPPQQPEQAWHQNGASSVADSQLDFRDDSSSTPAAGAHSMDDALQPADSGQQEPRSEWQYDAEDVESATDMEQGWGDLEGLLSRGMQLLRHARAGITRGADLGGIDVCLQDALACFEAAAAIDGTDARVLGNWGVTLLTYGQHKQSYLAMLQETGGASPSPRQDTAHAQSVMAREAAAIEASKARLRQESQHALVRAGQMFREVVKAEYGDKEDMQPVTQRTLTHWAKALCIRAALAEHAQEAAELYQSAVDKLRAVVAADAGHVPAVRALGLALVDLAALPNLEPYPLLQEAREHLESAARLNAGDSMLQAALQQCAMTLQQAYAMA